MKYIVLIYNNHGAWDALPEEQRTELIAEFDAVNKELTESGVFVRPTADPCVPTRILRLLTQLAVLAPTVEVPG